MTKEQFKTARLNAGWTLEVCASKLGVSRGTVSKYESGMHPVSATVEKLMILLAVPKVEVTRS